MRRGARRATRVVEIAWLASLAAGSAFAAPYRTAVTKVNRVGLTISNYGFFGNNFNSRSPSFEFPLGSGFEHMSRAGLWVGARALSDSGTVFTGVTTAIVDDAQGTNQALSTEFAPAAEIVERSRISNNPAFSPDAISDQDLVTTYADLLGTGSGGGQSEAHHPLHIEVEQRVLGFSLEVASSFEIVQFKIVNRGQPLENVYVGLYAQLSSGNKNKYSGWPPSSASTQGSWYYKTHVEYDSTRRLYQEHYCEGLPYPTRCNTAYCPPWAGVKLLKTLPDTIASKTVSFNWWSFNSDDTGRDEDDERYAILGNGARSDLSSCTPGGQSCSPIMVLSVGPFAAIDPGDSIRVDFAFIGGESESGLIADSQRAFLANADFVQFAADINYRLPSPPPSPKIHIEARERRVDFYWDDSPEFAEDPTSPAPDHRDFEGYRLYLGFDRQHPNLVAQFDRVDTTGFNTGFSKVRLDEPIEIDGVFYHYHYSVDGLDDGFNYFGAVTSYDIGDAQVASLESGISQNKFQVVPMPAAKERTRAVTVFPNPYRVEARWDRGALVRDHYLWFANLPQRCVLHIYTLSGDLVFETRFDGTTYRGENARGLYDPRQDIDTPAPVLPGSSFAWNLITREGQAAATGLYLFAVEDLATRRVSRGKFLIVKSDREN